MPRFDGQRMIIVGELPMLFVDELFARYFTEGVKDQGIQDPPRLDLAPNHLPAKIGEVAHRLASRFENRDAGRAFL